MYGSKIVAVIPYIMNLDNEYITDKMQDKALRLTSVDSFIKRSEKKNSKYGVKKNEKHPEGLQSEWFGTDFGDDRAFNERFSCKCKKYVGSMYRNKVCEVCGDTVGFQDIDLSKFGYPILDHFYIINPIYYEKLCALLGKSDGDYVIAKILNVRYGSKEDEPFTEREEEELKKHPYLYKGMIWLKDHLWEVLEYYRKKKPQKKAVFDEIEAGISDVFTHCLPVYSAAMRTEIPGERGGKVYKLKVNTIWKTIIRLTNFVNKFEEDELNERTLKAIDHQLYAIMCQVDKLYEVTVTELTSKYGMIMTKVTGGRYNFSARNVVICSSGRLRADEVELGYNTFLELFRYEIENYYMKMTNCSPQKADNVWQRAIEYYDPVLHSIMKKMVKDDECCMFISRNPMINYGSGIQVRIVAVKDDPSDKTMTLPSPLCVTSNADFDGDMFNLYRLFGADFIHRFGKNLNARKNLYVSRMNGKLNRDLLPIKNEWVGLWAFNNL